MLGKDLEARLQKLLRERRASSVPDLVDRCHKYLATQEQRLSARRFAALSDRMACLLTLTRDAKSVSEVKQRITDIFAPTDASLTFSTIHRAKGMEWDTVYFLDKHLLPSVFATTEADLQQERNLHYVAATRARLNLYFITSK
jgi:DNA helicase-2/ATP-dependent DNA helicase PcrA